MFALTATAREEGGTYYVLEDCQQSNSHSTESLGSTIAKVLTGAWRVSPKAGSISEDDLLLTAPLLYQSGDAALAWWRIRTSALATSRSGALLHDAYRHLRLAARVHEREIKDVVSLLRAEGMEPVLVKGWAVARLYPDSGLRPYGDIDLCVAPDQFRKALRILERLAEHDNHFVDLHRGFTKLTRESWGELFERSQLVNLGDEMIRVLSAADHLRVLCLHLLRSGAWRPLWLCDVALGLESRLPDFEWDICLTRDQRQADRTACTIGLAHQLLGVDIEDTPIAERAKKLPRWLVPAVLRQWGRCRNSDAAGMALPTLLSGITEPTKIFSEMYARWDNPVRSTVALRGRFSDWPRLPYQLGELILHSPEAPRQLALLLRHFVTPKALSQSIRDEVQAADI